MPAPHTLAANGLLSSAGAAKILNLSADMVRLLARNSHATDTGPFIAWEREMARLQQLATVLETESTTHDVSTRADYGPPIG